MKEKFDKNNAVPPKSVVINSKKAGGDVLRVARSVRSVLENRGIPVLATGVLAKKLGLRQSGLSGDAVVAIGGDGTILGTVRRLKGDTKILGIHTGTVGFLTEVGEDGAADAAERLANGEYKVEERSRISASIGKARLPPALNEISVITAVQARIIRIEVKIDGKTLGPFSADGIILSTPTGSTAYSLSAGGPILDPSARAFVLVPICPYNFATHSLVVPDCSRIEAKVLEGSAVVSVDGQVRRKVGQGQRIAAEKCGQPAKFVRLNEHFYKKLNGMVR